MARLAGGGARAGSRGRGGRGQGRRGGGISAGGRKGGKNAGGNSGSSGKGPRLGHSLLRAIGVSAERRTDDSDGSDKEIAGDVYEYEEEVPEEERGKNKRFDDIDRMEYELPSDFEDEEIDEDEADGEGASEEESDNEALPSSKVKKGKSSKEISLNSDEDDEGSEEEGEDMDDDREEEEEFRGGKPGEINSDSSEDEDEDEQIEDDDDDERHQRLIEAVTGRSVKPDRAERSRKEHVVTEAYPESEFNLNPSGRSANGSAQISVEDLMNPLHDAAGFGTLRKRMQELQNRGAPVQAPLPKVVQDRVDRQAGYKQTSRDISGWQNLVKRNREAPTLVFNKREETPALTTATLASTFKATTDFEKEIKSLLNKSKLMEAKDVEEAESLQLNKLTVEEVRERQERLSKMRNLLFRHELKAKRVRKIKSKTFHKLKNRSERSKAEHDMALAEADPEAAKEAAIKQEFLRAEERMTLKHKNQSRWAKRILKRGLKAQENDGTRDAIADQLRTHELLTRKIHSATLSGSDDNLSSSDESDDDDEPTGLVLGKPNSKILAKAKVATLKALEEGEDDDVPKTGLFAIPFMARAIEKKKKAAEMEAMAVLEQLEQAEAEGDILALHDDYARLENAEKKDTTVCGRISFGESRRPLENEKPQRTVAELSDVDDSDDERLERSVAGRVDMGETVLGVSSKKTRTDISSSLQADEQSGARFGLDFLTFLGKKPHSTGVEDVDVPAKQLDEEAWKCNKVSGPLTTIESTISALLETGADKETSASKIQKETPALPSSKASKRKKKQSKKKIIAVPVMTTSVETLPPPVTANGHQDSSVDKIVVGFAGRPKQGVIFNGHADPSNGETKAEGNEDVSNGTSYKEAEECVAVVFPAPSSFSDDDSDQEMDMAGDMMSQQALIRQAFAGDDVEAEFEQLKAQSLDVEVPQGEAPVTLPGWGQWSHVQQRRGPPAWILKEQEKLQKSREDALSKRKDAKLKHVVISEKMDKKASKFSSAGIPFPFKSREIYERSVRMPIGREYNTDKAYRNMIRPAVIKSAGQIIDPIKRERHSVKEEEAFTRQPKRKRGRK